MDFIRRVWSSLIIKDAVVWFFSSSLRDWCENNLRFVKVGTNEKMDWRCCFLTAIWRRRCKFIFDVEDVELNTDKFAAQIISGANELHKFSKKAMIGTKDYGLIGWSAPGDGIVKVNTDGAARGNPGGLLRTANGVWLVGFQASLGICSNIVAELQAVRFGMLLAWDKGFRKVICELDAEVVICLVKSAETSVHPYGEIIQDIREIMGRNWECTIQHVLREANFSADVLAKGCL